MLHLELQRDSQQAAMSPHDIEDSVKTNQTFIAKTTLQDPFTGHMQGQDAQKKHTALLDILGLS